VQLVELALLEQELLLGEATLGRVLVVELLELLHASEALGDGREVGEEATEPALVDVGLADARRLLGEDFLRLLLGADEEDGAAVRDGLYPPMSDEPPLPVQLARIRDMLADLPSALARRNARDASTAENAERHDDLPDYFVQDFHFQTGGYLTNDSARLYDLQVETLFYGAAGAMRRQALRPIAAFMHGRDQRQVRLLDVACGTGGFLRAVRLAYPAMKLPH